MKYEIRNASRGQADCFFIMLENCNGETCNILIDGNRDGVVNLELLKDEISKMDKLDFVVVTHIDNDHIGGVLKLFQEHKNNALKQLEKTKVIYNYITKGMITYEQAALFEELMDEKYIIQSFNRRYDNKDSMLKLLQPRIRNVATSIEKKKDKNAYLTFLNPSKVGVEAVVKKYRAAVIDRELINANSICFLLEFAGVNALFLGDAYCGKVQDVLDNLKHLHKVDLIKIPHHGALENNKGIVTWSKEKECNRFIVTGKEDWDRTHPNKQLIDEFISEIGGDLKLHTKVELNQNDYTIKDEIINMLG